MRSTCRYAASSDQLVHPGDPLEILGLARGLFSTLEPSQAPEARLGTPYRVLSGVSPNRPGHPQERRHLPAPRRRRSTRASGLANASAGAEAVCLDDANNATCHG
jgi:hypothetical protein